MSWNCWVSTSCHSSSSSCGSPSPAYVIHSSASRSSRSQRRLPSFVRSWLVSVPRWVSKYSSPRHTGTGAPRGDLGLDGVEEVGRRAQLDVRHARRGPPIRRSSLEHLPRRTAAAVAVPERHQRPPCSTRARRSGRPSRPAPPAMISALYVSTGGKWVSTRVPSRPSHQNVECGKRLVRFHDSFWVTNRRHAAGGEDLRQARPGSRTRRGSTPRGSAGRSAPRRSAARGRSGARCSRRTAGSCPARPTSRRRGSTARRRPCRRCGRTAPARARRSTRTAGPASTRSGSPGSASISATAEANVRVHLRTVSASGHSHAVSMWACPVATTRCGAASSGRGEHRREHGPGGGRRVVAAARRPRRARRAPGRRPPGAAPGGDRPGRACASRRRARRGRGRAPRRRRRRRTSSARSRRYSGRSPAVAGEPSGDGRNCGNVGFDAASTTSSTGPGSPRDRHGLAPWVDALHRATLAVAHQALALEARRVEPEAEVEQRLDTAPRPRRPAPRP